MQSAHLAEMCHYIRTYRCTIHHDRARQSKSPEEDDEASELDEAEEVLG